MESVQQFLLPYQMVVSVILLDYNDKLTSALRILNISPNHILVYVILQVLHHNRDIFLRSFYISNCIIFPIHISNSKFLLSIYIIRDGSAILIFNSSSNCMIFKFNSSLMARCSFQSIVFVKQYTYIFRDSSPNSVSITI